MYKGKDKAFDRGNYRGSKLKEHILKVKEQIIEDLIRNIVKIDNMQFGFMSGRGTTDAIFIVRQIQEVYIRKNWNLYFDFVDLEKSFGRGKFYGGLYGKLVYLNGLCVYTGNVSKCQKLRVGK